MSLILSGTDGLSDVDGSAATPAIRGTDANTGIFFPAADTIAFSEGGVEAMRIDSGGNVGIGVTPSAWDTYANNIQTPTGSIVSYSPSSNLGMVQNAYFSSGWKYSTTNAATFYLQSTGVHSWSYASSGTAGNAVTFTEAMRINSSGNVGIGTSSPTARLHSIATSGTTTTLGRFEAAVGGYTGTSLIAANTLGPSSAYNLFSCITDSDGDAGGPFTQFLVTGDGNVIVGGTSTSSNESTYQGGGVFTSRRASSAGTTHANFLNGGSTVGSITSNTTTTFYNTTSDYRLKENATPVTTGLQTIAALNPVNFDWVSNRIADTGFLAHEFQAVIPNCVMGTKDAIDENGNPVYQQIDRSGAIPFLVAAIKEQQALITALTARITALETP